MANNPDNDDTEITTPDTDGLHEQFLAGAEYVLFYLQSKIFHSDVY